VIHVHKPGLWVWDDHTPGHGRLTVGIEMVQKDGPGELFIVEGPDPHVLIADEALYSLRYRPQLLHPNTTLQRPSSGHGACGHSVGDYDCGAIAGGRCYHASILRLKTVDRDLVYVIDKYEPELHGWWAHWPD